MAVINNRTRSTAPRFTEEKTGGKSNVAMVSAVGDVDRGGIEACDFLLSRAGDPVTGAVLDLTQATHVDYRSMPIIVARRRVFKARGGELAVAAASAEVRNIIRASAGAEVPVFATLDEAVSYVRGDAEVVTAGASRQVRRPRSVKSTRPV